MACGPAREVEQARVQRGGGGHRAQRAAGGVEIVLVLKHVGQVGSAGEALLRQACEGERAEPHRLAQHLCQRRRHRLAAQVLGGHTDGLTDRRCTLLEQRQRASADVGCCDPGQQPFADGQHQLQPAVGTAYRAHAQVQQVVPVERGTQKGGGHAEFGEIGIAFGLAVHVRHLVSAGQQRQARVVHRRELAGVFERRPHEVLHPGLPRRQCDVPRLLLFPRRAVVLPVVGDGEDRVHTGQGALQRGRVVEVGEHHLGAGGGQHGRGLRPACQRTQTKRRTSAGQQRLRQAAALCAGGADHGQDGEIGVVHGVRPHCGNWMVAPRGAAPCGSAAGAGSPAGPAART